MRRTGLLGVDLRPTNRLPERIKERIRRLHPWHRDFPSMMKKGTIDAPAEVPLVRAELKGLLGRSAVEPPLSGPVPPQ